LWNRPYIPSTSEMSAVSEMVAIKPIADIAAKFAEVTPGRVAYYESGVRSPDEDWETETAAAEKAYEQGVSAAVARKAFAKGVKDAGTKKWQDKTIAKGLTRWPEGVRLAEPDFAAGFGPYRDIIERITLPKRGPRGDPANYDRSRKIGDALNKARLGTK